MRNACQPAHVEFSLQITYVVVLSCLYNFWSCAYKNHRPLGIAMYVRLLLAIALTLITSC